MSIRWWLELTLAYIKQSLALATLGNALAGRFEELLSQQVRQLLERLYPEPQRYRVTLMRRLQGRTLRRA